MADGESNFLSWLEDRCGKLFHDKLVEAWGVFAEEVLPCKYRCLCNKNAI
jgi:hypothetical protein